MTEKSTQAVNVKRVVEAILFAADRPISLRRLALLLGEAADGRAVRKAVDELREEYDARGAAFQIQEIAEGLQLLTHPEYQPWIAKLFSSRRDEKISPASLETLAIVAYKQPVLRAQIEDIRGVQAGQILRQLLERGLIKIVGRHNSPGRPILYGTTRRFMQHFGLRSLRDLPDPEKGERLGAGQTSQQPPSQSDGGPETA